MRKKKTATRELGKNKEKERKNKMEVFAIVFLFSFLIQGLDGLNAHYPIIGKLNTVKPSMKS